MANEVKKASTFQRLDAAINSEVVVNKFKAVLGKEAPMFIANILSSVQKTPGLMDAEPSSIISAAYEASSYDLPIDPNLGFAAIVPYKNRKKNPKTGKWEEKKLAQFQMMYRGFIQLAIRTGQYKSLTCTEIYKDEVIKINPIRDEYVFVDGVSPMRTENNPENVVGYYASLELTTGFRKEFYMTKEQMQAHAERYSSAYRYDLNENKESSKWSTDFDAMGKKTVIKLLISKWGIMTTKMMQKAIKDDQMVFDEDGDGAYTDNQPDVVEAKNVFAIEEKPLPPDPALADPIDEPVPEEVPTVEVETGKTQEDEFAEFEQAYERGDA